MYLLRSLIFFLFSACFFSVPGHAQCISQFPYTEDFEKNDGGWTTGGNASDWAWGIPNKQSMLRAGNGAKCWVSGGLTGNHYNDNEASWLQSPCFDFTSIALPYISFYINWDTEKGYDGAGVQYSVDKGITWQSAGAFGDVASACTPNNWYTDANIRYAMQPAGWSGSSQTVAGNIAGWVKAYHIFPELAGKTDVRFRFVFGAGNIKNDYGGVGIDNIYIGETIANNQLSFTYTCSVTAREASFFAYRSDCIDFRTLQWNFNDPASGDANIVYSEGLVHDFSAAGIYQVTLSGKDNFGNVLSSQQTIIIPDVTAIVATPVTCHGETGIIEASVTNTSAPIYYIWSADTSIHSSAGDVKAGFHQIQATVEGGCMNYINITLPEPDALHHRLQIEPADCNDLNGMVVITESGGVAPYQYHWLPSISADETAENVASGSYNITVTDKNLCSDTIIAVVPKETSSLTHSVDTMLPDCGEQNGKISIKAAGGSPAYVYEWAPVVSMSETADNIGSGTYRIVITDSQQCRDTATVTLADKPIQVSLGNDTAICKGQSIWLHADGNYASYIWNDGTTFSKKEVNKEGDYSLTITNAGGCIASDTIHVYEGCGDLMFPSGFTPNGDGHNEEWGGSGGLSQVSAYRLVVFNRYGDVVFQSANPFQKWKGDTKGNKVAGTYVFIASYLYQEQKKIKKGTVTVLL